MEEQFGQDFRQSGDRLELLLVELDGGRVVGRLPGPVCVAASAPTALWPTPKSELHTNPQETAKQSHRNALLYSSYLSSGQ